MESRRTCEPLSRFRLLVPLLLILLLAFGLRVWGLTSLPPGLTHDEANHGREAIGILDGVLKLKPGHPVAKRLKESLK